MATTNYNSSKALIHSFHIWMPGSDGKCALHCIDQHTQMVSDLDLDDPAFEFWFPITSLMLVVVTILTYSVDISTRGQSDVLFVPTPLADALPLSNSPGPMWRTMSFWNVPCQRLPTVSI
jgi:hypothetical protein